MFDSQAVVVATIGGFYMGIVRSFLGFSKGVERHLHALVADGMEADLEAREHALFGHVIQLGGFVSRQAGVLRIVGIRLQHRGRVRSRANHP